MNSVGRHSRRVESRESIHDCDRTLPTRLAWCPISNRITQLLGARKAIGTARWGVHRENLGHEDDHIRLRSTHLVDECIKGCDDVGGRGGAIMPYVICAEVHHHDVWCGRREPSRELIVLHNIDRLKSALGWLTSEYQDQSEHIHDPRCFHQTWCRTWSRLMCPQSRYSSCSLPGVPSKGMHASNPFLMLVFCGVTRAS